MARTTSTRAFKLQAVRLMADQGLSVAEVARRRGGGEGLFRGKVRNTDFSRLSWRVVGGYVSWADAARVTASTA